jgi:hypothetical protein
MKTSWGILVAVLATMTGTAILGDMVSEEIRGRLDRLPHALIRLAARWLPPDVREDLAEEWSAELHEILRGAEALPITGLSRGTLLALGGGRAGARIGRDVTAPAADEPSGIPHPPTVQSVRDIGIVFGGVLLAVAESVGDVGASVVFDIVFSVFGIVSVVWAYQKIRARRRGSGRRERTRLPL